MTKTTLNIKGMHCKSCEILITDALTQLGVKECKIDHKTGLAEIVYNEKKISLELIKSTIKKEGYVI